MSSSTSLDGSFEAILEDYLTRVDNGEHPDRTEYLTRYPEHTRQLAEFFDDLDVVDSSIAHETPIDRTQRSEPRGAETAAIGFASRSNLPEMDGFKVLEEIGSGGQGFVYRAKQLGTKRIVALKVMREGVFASKEERQRFEREVELASRLDHPNIAAVYECGQDAGRAYFAMQYVDGEPLDIYMSTRTLDIPDTLRMFLQICGAIAYAHQRGVIHRDVKPSNMIVDASGKAYVVDFGLAKVIRTIDSAVGGSVTQVGDFAGTWYYASPEQVRREPSLIDVRTDVYALGVILYELLTDCYPYRISDESKEGIAHHILNTEPTSPSAIRRDIDDELETIVLRALHKDSERRYQSAVAFGEDIERYLRGEAIEAKRDSPWYALRKALRRYRWQVAIASGAIAALLAFATTIFVLYRQAQAARATTRARMGIVRDSQKYLIGKLDELSWTANRLAQQQGFNAAPFDPGVNDPQAMREAEELLRVVADMPAALYEGIWSERGAGYDEATTWLRSHERELAEIEDRAPTTRFALGLSSVFGSDLVIDDYPRHLGKLEGVSEAMIGRAVQAFRANDYSAAVRSLDTARAIAVALGDGRLLHQRTRSVAIRSRIYESVLRILGDVGAKTEAQPFIEWALLDPPLVEYRHSMISERQKLSQLYEEATFANNVIGTEYVDLDALDTQCGGLFEELGFLTDENRALARSVSPSEVLFLIDLLIKEAEQWDPLPSDLLAQRADALREKLREQRAWPLLRPLLPSYREVFRHRRWTVALRAGMLLSVHLCRHRHRHGRWPEQLIAAIPPESRLYPVDPYVGRPFKYRLENGSVTLYSVNEDGLDGGERNGSWGSPKTDVVVFESR